MLNKNKSQIFPEKNFYNLTKVVNNLNTLLAALFPKNPDKLKRVLAIGNVHISLFVRSNVNFYMKQ